MPIGSVSLGLPSNTTILSCRVLLLLFLPHCMLINVDDELDCSYCRYVQVTHLMDHFLAHVWSEVDGFKVRTPFKAILNSDCHEIALKYRPHFQCQQCLMVVPDTTALPEECNRESDRRQWCISATFSISSSHHAIYLLNSFL